jgi:hypothetical protein
MFTETGDQEETPWQANFPPPRTTKPGAITREDLLARFEAGQKGGRDFLLVDVRRTDHEVSPRVHAVGSFRVKIWFHLRNTWRSTL